MLPLPTVQTGPKPSSLKVRTVTFGCKVNRADTVHLESTFTKGGATLVDETATPDVVIVNTCTVTSAADRQARQLLRRLHRQFPEARILVTGCSVEADPKKISTIEGVTELFPIRQQTEIPKFLGLEVSEDSEPMGSFAGRTRAFLKLQDGCNAYCSFCILPFIRGRGRSIELSSLVSQAKGFEKAGFLEIVVTGTHIGTYGRDFDPRLRLSDVLRKLSQELSNSSIRVSSLEPMTLSPDVVRVVREFDRIRPHFHIPLQSGSDTVLRRMNRKYRSEKFLERVWALRNTREEMGLGTDVIVGYPGETDEEFEATVNLLRKSPITFLHVFRFSARPGTKAAQMKDTVSDRTKYDRMKVLMKMGKEMKKNFYDRFVDQNVTVLIESKRDEEGYLTGYSPHYVPVRVEGADRLMQKEIEVRITKNMGEFVLAKVV